MWYYKKRTHRSIDDNMEKKNSQYLDEKYYKSGIWKSETFTNTKEDDGANEYMFNKIRWALD
jgi:hypothetical protein